MGTIIRTVGLDRDAAAERGSDEVGVIENRTKGDTVGQGRVDVTAVLPAAPHFRSGRQNLGFRGEIGAGRQRRRRLG